MNTFPDELYKNTTSYKKNYFDEDLNLNFRYNRLMKHYNIQNENNNNLQLLQYGQILRENKKKMNWRKTLLNSAIRTGMYLGGKAIGNYIGGSRSGGGRRTIVIRKRYGRKRYRNYRTGGPWRRNQYLGSSGSALKYHDFTSTTVNPSTTGTLFTNAIAIPQNTGPADRIGQRVILKKITIRGSLRTNGTATAQNIGTYITKLMVVLDKQCNGAFPSFTDIQTNNLYGYNNLDNVDRFVILKTLWLQINPTVIYNGAAMLDTKKQRAFKFSVPLNYEIIYSSNMGVIAEIKSNNIFVCCISNDSGSTDLDFKARVRFQDKMQ